MKLNNIDYEDLNYASKNLHLIIQLIQIIVLSKMNKDSENLCIPIINIDSEGKNLICCYKSLELNLGKICPTFYSKPFLINIISFVKEDMVLKIKSYKENKIDIKNDEE